MPKNKFRFFVRAPTVSSFVSAPTVNRDNMKIIKKAPIDVNKRLRKLNGIEDDENCTVTV